MERKRKVAVFDFDGTLTTHDTLVDFIKYTHGTIKCYCGLLIFAPLISLMKLKILPNWKVKQWLFSWFYEGMEYNRFAELGLKFADIVDGMRNESVIGKLKELKDSGAVVYVVSASIEEWVRPFCTRLGVKDVLGTRIEVGKDGKLTGNFLTKNCYGQEKVNRLLEVEPLRSEYYLYAFGDSRGDKEMLEFADKGMLL